MRRHMQEAFGQIQMPEACIQEVTKAMKEQKTKRNKTAGSFRAVPALAAMAAVVLVMTFVLNTQVQAAVEDAIRYFFGGFSSIVKDETTGEIVDVLQFPGEEESPVFVETKEGRIFLSIYGEYIDITDKTTMETPYIYSYVDEEKIEHLLIIGGLPNNFGICEFYRETAEGHWMGGYSENYFDNEAETPYPWVVNAWAQLNLPWPVPGT